MRFTLFSVLLLLLIGLAVFIEVIRGIKHGFSRAAIGLSAVAISAVGALGLSVWLSDLIADELTAPIVDQLTNSMDLIETYLQNMPHLQDVIHAAIDVVMTVLLFVVCFLLLRGILRLVIRFGLAFLWRAEDGDPRDTGSDSSPNTLHTPCYEGQNGSWVRRHDRMLGGIVGGLTGFLVAFILLSPVVGSLTLARDIVDEIPNLGIMVAEDEDEEKDENGDSPEELAATGETGVVPLSRTENGKDEDAENPFDVATMFTDDVIVTVLDATGGRLFFDAMTVSNLDGRTVTLRDEVDASMAVIPDFIEIINILFDNEELTRRQERTVEEFGGKLAESQTMSVLATDFLGGASTAWLYGREFMEIPCPSFGSFVTPVMNQVFNYFAVNYTGANFNPSFVSEDIQTMLQVYLIASQNGLLRSQDAEEMMVCIDEDNVLDRIYQELQKNPRMGYIAGYLTEATMRAMAQTVAAADLPPELQKELMTNLASSLSYVKGMTGAELEEQIDIMSSEAVKYAEQYGFELPESAAELAVSHMINQFKDQPIVTPEMMQQYFDSIGLEAEMGPTGGTTTLPGEIEDFLESLPDTLPVEIPDEIPDINIDEDKFNDWLGDIGYTTEPAWEDNDGQDPTWP